MVAAMLCAWQCFCADLESPFFYRDGFHFVGLESLGNHVVSDADRVNK
jgi:hypothetical protein